LSVNQVKVTTPNRLYVKETTQPGENREAIGEVLFPQDPGEYRLVFQLAINGVGTFPHGQNSIAELKTRVLAQ
jgi:hypothetical protein